MLNNPTVFKVANTAKDILLGKLTTSIESMLRLSRFGKDECLDDLGYSSCLLIGIIHALATCDILLCSVLLEMAESHRPLHSSYFVTWLLDYFELDDTLVKQANERVESLRSSSTLVVPDHVSRIVKELAVRSGVASTGPLGEVKSTNLVSVATNTHECETTNQVESTNLVSDATNTQGKEITTQVESKNPVSVATNTQETKITTQVESTNLVSFATNTHESETANQMGPADNIMVLLKAVTSNNSKAIEELAVKGVNMTSLVGGQSLLHIAAKAGAIDSVKTLIKLGARINCRDKHCFTPLHRAVEADNAKMVLFLIEAGADAGCKLPGGKTLLMHALSGNCLSAAATLLNLGSDPNQKNDNGETALITTLKHYRHKLQSIDGKLDKTTSENICKAIALLEKNGADVNAASAKGYTALHISAMLNDVPITETLVRLGSDKTGKNKDYSTIINCQNKAGHTPLHVAALHGNREVLGLLIKLKAHLEIQDKKGFTPLYLAAMYGHVDVVDMLSKKRIQIDHKTHDRNTPLHIAAEKGHAKVAQLLIKRGANVNAIGYLDYTPLHYAAGKGHFSVVDLLTKYPVKINHFAQHYLTPLELAMMSGNMEAFELLIKRGANLSLVGMEGHLTVADLLSGSHLHIIGKARVGKTALGRGAKINVPNYSCNPRHLSACEVICLHCPESSLSLVLESWT